MRRKDRKITDEKLVGKILEEAEVIRIAMVEDGEPYIVAMNFAYKENSIYMHSAKEGRKIDILRKNDKVAFQTEIGVELFLPDNTCRCGTRYTSVFGTGKAQLIDDKDEKTKALDAIMAKYTGKDTFDYLEDVINRTLVIKVEIESMTGKKSG